MHRAPFRWCLYALIAGISLSTLSSAGMVDLRIQVTNEQPAGGFGLAPVWIGIHDGTFSTFTSGETASAGLQTLAELGDTSGLMAAFAGHGAQTTVGSMPYVPGFSATSLLSVTNPSTDQYLSFAGMVVPSNDFFMANSDPQAFHLFDSSGHFLGPLTIQVFGQNVWDAGTEVNNITFGAAFIAGDNATDHVAENGTVGMVFGGSADYSSYLNSILGQTTAANYNISHVISSGDLIATIQINAVPEPSTAMLMGVGMAGCLALMLRGRS